MRSHLCTLALFGFLLPIAAAQELPLPVTDLQRTESVDFAKEIMPILKKNCLACHHEKEAEGGLSISFWYFPWMYAMRERVCALGFWM